VRAARVDPCKRHEVAIRARLVGPARAQALALFRAGVDENIARAGDGRGDLSAQVLAAGEPVSGSSGRAPNIPLRSVSTHLGHPQEGPSE
jgi:hypothetical protein